jgi:plastocyanin
MRFALTSAALATFATVASAVQTQVIVGGGPLAYNPPQVTAAVGDTIQFVFMPKNHTVTQSTFAAPCQAMPNGLDSGFVPVAANATSTQAFTITVNTTTPLWFYCRQVEYVTCSTPSVFHSLGLSYALFFSHCQNGMVFAVNPTANKTFAAFQGAANASGTTTSASPSASSGSSGTGTGSTGTGSTATGAGASSSPSSTSTKPNGALTVGAHAGGLLTVVGFVAGILL